jgi:hypothetical protein
MKDVQIWEMDDVDYFGGIWPDRISYEKLRLQPIFDYVCKMGFENDEGMWWTDEYGMDFSPSGAITFMTDFIEQNPNHKIEIECTYDVMNVSVNCDGCAYYFTDFIRNDAHNRLFEMLIWVLAKSLGFEESMVIK